MTAKQRGRRAWLITWDWAGEHAAVLERDVVVAILWPQTSSKTVQRLMEVLYAASQYGPAEKLDLLVHNPYPARLNRIHGVPYDGQIHCGHNPFLYGRLVDNLRKREPDNPDSLLMWDERPLPTPWFARS